MRKFFFVLLMSSLGHAAPGPSHPPAQKESRGAFVISSNLWGYLAPCGCSENMRGGMARAAYHLEEMRRQYRFLAFLDGGDALFGPKPMTDVERPQARRKARAIAEALTQMGIFTQGVGELDDALGVPFRRTLGLPEQPEQTVRLLDWAGEKVAVVTGKDGAELKAAAESARKQKARFVVGLLHRNLEEAQRAVEREKPAVDLVVATHAQGEFAAEDNRIVPGAPPVVQLQSKGRSLLQIELAWGTTADAFSWLPTEADTQKEASTFEARIAQLTEKLNSPGLSSPIKEMYRAKISELALRRERLLQVPPKSVSNRNTFVIRFVPLETSLPSSKKMAELVSSYESDVSKLNLKWAQAHPQTCPRALPNEASFVGNASCARCHPKAAAFWKKTKHAGAYAELSNKGRAYDLECIGCHVTGFQKPGGVCRVDDVQGRTDVGCESCHGPGSAHAKTPSTHNIVAPPTESACIGCHNRENSPHFLYSKYVTEILGPGHGRPASESF